MPTRITRGSLGLASVLVTLSLSPTVAAQPLGPSTLVDAGPLTRAIASFVLVVLFGAAVLFRRAEFVDGAVDDTLERPLVGVVYGLLAYVLVLFAALYVADVITRLGFAGTPFGYVALAILVGGVGLLAGVGSLVLGTVLTDLVAVRQPLQGLVLGAGLAAVGWLALPDLAAAAIWVLIPAIGLGGPMRKWVHRDRALETELQSG